MCVTCVRRQGECAACLPKYFQPLRQSKSAPVAWTCFLSSVLANQRPCCSAALSEDEPGFPQSGPLLSVWVCASLKSSCCSCCRGASLPRWPRLIISPTHTTSTCTAAFFFYPECVFLLSFLVKNAHFCSFVSMKDVVFYWCHYK